MNTASQPAVPAIAVPMIAMLLGTLTGLWLGLRRRSRLARRVRSLLAPGPGPGTHPAPGRRRGRIRQGVAGFLSIRPPWLVPELVLLPVGLAAGQLTRSAVPLLAAAFGVVPLRRWRLRRRSSAQARRRSTAVIDLCAQLGTELGSGATPEQALHVVLSRSGPALSRSLGAEPVARLAAARYGADVPAALRIAAELPGGRGAAALAACWQVTAESGTGLAAALEQVADALRAERALAEEIAGELAGPRTTVAMLAALPLVGAAMGSALGARPVQVLLHTPAGLVCLLVGVVLEAVGLAWTARIVRTAEGSPVHRLPAARGTVRGAALVAAGVAAGVAPRQRKEIRAERASRRDLGPWPDAGTLRGVPVTAPCGISRTRRGRRGLTVVPRQRSGVTW